MVGASLKANVFIEIWDDDLIGTLETLIASLPSGGLSSVCLSVCLSVCQTIGCGKSDSG